MAKHPTADWLVSELATDKPWIYSPEGDTCFWCGSNRVRISEFQHADDFQGHENRCPWILAWKYIRKED